MLALARSSRRASVLRQGRGEGIGIRWPCAAAESGGGGEQSKAADAMPAGCCWWCASLGCVALCFLLSVRACFAVIFFSTFYLFSLFRLYIIFCFFSGPNLCCVRLAPGRGSQTTKAKKNKALRKWPYPFPFSRRRITVLVSEIRKRKRSWRDGGTSSPLAAWALCRWCGWRGQFEKRV
ncbi:hypothetical protein SEVIR_7G038452v4 [Setaria viridis]